MHSKNLDAYLEQAGGINSLIPQAKRLLELRHAFLESIPAPLSELATVANYRQGKVVIFAANSAVAAKLKLMAPALKDRFLRMGMEVTALDIEVQPGGNAARTPPKVAVLSEAAHQALVTLSAQLPDSKLKDIISSLITQKVRKR